MTTRHLWLLIVTDPNGEEITLWSTQANADRAKRQCMELWMQADCSAMELPELPPRRRGSAKAPPDAGPQHRSTRRPEFTSLEEEYLRDCGIEFFITRLEVDDERYSHLLLGGRP